MKICNQCNYENDDGAKFCNQCGATLPTGSNTESETTTASDFAETIPAGSNIMTKFKTKLSAKGERILGIVRSSLLLALTLVMFIMSFMGVSKVGGSAIGSLNLGTSSLGTSSLEASSLGASDLSDLGISDLDGLMDVISVDVTPIDLIEGAFARVEPKTDEEVSVDFVQYMLDHLSDRDRKVLDNCVNGSDVQIFNLLHIVTGLIEDYNIFKLGATQENVEVTPAQTVELWVCALFSFAYIGLNFALFLFALIDFTQTLRGKKTSSKAFFALFVATITTAIAFAFVLNLIYGAVAYGLTTTIILALAALIFHFVDGILNGEIKFEKSKVLRYVSAAVGTVFTLIMLGLSCDPLTKILCESTGGALSFKASYDAPSLAAAWNTLRESKLYPDLLPLGSAKEYVPFLLSSGSKSGLSPANMGVMGNMKIETTLALMGVLVELCSVAVIIVLALSLSDRIRSLAQSRHAKTVYTILIPVFVALLLGTTIIYLVLVNLAMNNYSDFTYSVSVSAPLIALTIFALLEMAQRIIFKSIREKQ